ncbi:MAG: tRNA adenosine(34) deaminase TadA [Candidatus Saccharicenans sp.]
MSDKNIIFMREAIVQARKAQERGEVPVGAVVVKGDEIIARGYNRPLSFNDPTAHAEIVAIRRAARKLKNYRLTGLTLYVTVEPCPMCLGAIIQSRIKRLVYGTSDPKGGAVVSKLRFDINKANHRLEVISGVCQAECRQLLTDFFKKKRINKKDKNGQAVEKPKDIQ